MVNTFDVIFNKAKTFEEIVLQDASFLGEVLIVNSKKGDTLYSFRNSPISSYLIGSLSKIFISHVFYILEDKDILDLNLKIGRLVSVPEHFANVTINELLNHTSGLDNYTESPAFFKLLSNPNSTRSSYLELIFSQDTLGSKSYKYSNSNYFILSTLLEIVLKSSLNDILSKYIFKPLGLNSTYAIEDQDFEGGFSLDNQGNYCPQINQKPGVSAFGAGNIISTAKDLQIFFQYLLSNKKYYDRLPLKYDPSKKIKFHGGITLGFQSFFGKPEDDFFVLILSNCDSDLREEIFYFFTDPTLDLPRIEKGKIKIADSKIQFRANNEIIDFEISSGLIYLIMDNEKWQLFEYKELQFCIKNNLTTAFKFNENFKKLTIINSYGGSYEETEAVYII